jgi:hypothetical protein
MGQGRLMRWIVCRILLIALAIQGITADAQDVASVNALRLLCLVPVEFDLLDDGDEWPDDVCEAAGAEMNCVVLRKVESDLASVCYSRSHDDSMGLFEQAAARIGAHSGPFSTSTTLIRSLCRLLC